jgi:precorrin-3B methylase
MFTPEHLFTFLGWTMVTCVAVFYLADPVIPWEKIAKRVVLFLAVGIIVLFLGSLIVDFPVK